jgi:hypothetical protein
MRSAIGVRHRALPALLAAGALLAALVGCAGSPPTPTPTAAGSIVESPSPSRPPTAQPWTPTASPSPEPVTILVGAGDICRADYISRARATATLVQSEIEANPETIVFTLGDSSNELGTAAQYRDCFDKTWGAFKDRIRPVAGNHDQYTDNGAPYYAYFGDAAGPAGKGYYSYDPDPYWHVIVLNAICWKVGGCGKSSPQNRWLAADLAASRGKHIVAMWHVPSFSSGGHGNTATYRGWWDALYAAGAEMVLSGHDHDYERFAPQSPAGVKDSKGIRQFVAGTGGAAHSPILFVRSNSQVRNSLTYGVLELTLKPHSYAWRFLPVAGSSFTDSGETATHF